MTGESYQTYVARFDREVGPIAVGAYGKWKGKLVRRLSEGEFATKQNEYLTLDKTYRLILERGDTINDAVVKLWRERGAELLLDPVDPQGPRQ
jgi:hypothetical protein